MNGACTGGSCPQSHYCDLDAGLQWICCNGYGCTDLESDPKHYDFTRVHTEGALDEKDWANELHPYPPGFEKLARRFLDALQTRFRGRI